MKRENHSFFTSESVAIGHPDKVADQISDAVLDECLLGDPFAKVACETLVSTGLVVLAGEISTQAHVDFQAVARDTIKNIGYDDCLLGFDSRTCAVIVAINEQSPEIAKAVIEGGAGFHQPGAGDQGMMFGYACDETEQLMPIPIYYSHEVMRALHRLRKSEEMPFLRPDAKVQITCEYDEKNRPLRIDTVVLSTQHSPDIDEPELRVEMKEVLLRVLPEELIDSATHFYINPSGKFVIGGPIADCGITGRKIIVDTYGGACPHGGGAFSGKDPTKVDRSAAYGARYVAKHIVAAQLARRCEVQVSYAIGVPFPISIRVHTFGTAQVEEHALVHAVREVFDLSPEGLIEMLDLRRPIYRKTAFGGHFGRKEEEFTWERTDRVEELLAAVQEYKPK